MCAYPHCLNIFRTGLLFILVVGGCHAVNGQDDVFVRSSSQPTGKGSYKWTIYIEASQPVPGRIKCVEYNLPPSYRNFKRSLCTPKYKYPFRMSDTATGNSLEIGITVYFADNKFRVLPVYSLRLQQVIDNPGGIAITPVIRLEQRGKKSLTPAEVEGLVVEVGDIHESRNKPFLLKIYKAGSSYALKEGNIYLGNNVQLPFNYNGKDYILSGYTETGKVDFLIFRIFRRQ